MHRLLILLSFVFLMTFFTSFAQEEDSTPSSLWTETYYAPYVYMARYPIYQFANIAQEQGIRYFSLGFILAGRGCVATWAGTVPVDSSYIYNFLRTDLPALRELGGDVIPSLGGASGTDLAIGCDTVESLTAELMRLIDIYELTRLDFDIEGDDIRDLPSIERRSQAIAALQAERDIFVSYTLPVLPTGLTEEGIFVLENAIEHGARVDVVNIMTMNFGERFSEGTMGEKVIQAAESLYNQLESLYPEKTSEELWAMIGLTPMAGLNDRATDIFMPEDAQLVTDFALENGIRMLSLWSLDRDQPCEFVNSLANDCSAVEQDPYAFSTIMNVLSMQDEE